MQKTFLGIPVDGDIVRAEHRVEQKPLEELAPLLQALLDDIDITAFGWRQYTPYFNDGEPCIFHTSAPWAARHENGEDYDKYDLEILWGNHTFGSEERGARCTAMARAIGSGAFDDVLLEAFGDHADVTVRHSGITVEFYEHD